MTDGAVEAAASVEVDVSYIDPPYNQHSYMGNYHMWESLVRWDKPETYGVANKRIQCREYKSPFNSKRKIKQALTDVLDALHSKHLLVSFNDEGYLNRKEVISILSERGYVGVASVDFKRYVGAQIGIYNPSGEKVGKVGRLDNKEFLFVVSPSKPTVETVVGVIERSVREQFASVRKRAKTRA